MSDPSRMAPRCPVGGCRLTCDVPCAPIVIERDIGRQAAMRNWPAVRPRCAAIRATPCCYGRLRSARRPLRPVREAGKEVAVRCAYARSDASFTRPVPVRRATEVGVREPCSTVLEARRHRPGADPHRPRDPRTHQGRQRRGAARASRPAGSPWPAGWPERIAGVTAPDGPVGSLDITMYRDDLRHAPAASARSAPSIPGRHRRPLVVLVDDVLFSGRTVRAALDALERPRPAARRAAGRPGRPRPPRAADPGRLRRQEPPDVARERVSVLLDRERRPRRRRR